MTQLPLSRCDVVGLMTKLVPSRAESPAWPVHLSTYNKSTTSTMPSSAYGVKKDSTPRQKFPTEKGHSSFFLVYQILCDVADAKLLL